MRKLLLTIVATINDYDMMNELYRAKFKGRSARALDGAARALATPTRALRSKWWRF